MGSRINSRKTHTPLYFQIARDIREKIYAGALAPMSRLPAEDALAKRYGVSRVTIRGALRKLHTEGLILRVNGKGTFVSPDILTRERRIILVLEKSPQRVAHLHELLAGAIVQAQQSGCSVLVCSNDELRAHLESAARTASRQSGVVLLRCRNYKKADIDFAEKHGIACIMEGVKPRPGYNWITVDNAGAMRELVDHVHGLGRRRFGIFNVKVPYPWSAFEDRYSAALARLRDLGVPRKDIRTVTVSGNLTSTPYRLTRRFFQAGRGDIDALICLNDKVAAQALRWMSDNRIKVPQDVAVTGFDDVTIATYTNPPLTTARQDYFNAGIEAVTELVGLMDDYDGRRIQRTRKLKVVIRPSTIHLA